MKLFLLFISFALFAQTPKVPEEELEVELGIDKPVKLDFAFSTKVLVGNNSVLDLTLIPQRREVILKGMKEGKTSVTIRNTVGDIKKRYIVKVKSSANSKVVKELKEFLGKVEGLEIAIKGGKVVVEGFIVVPDDIGLVSIILSKYPDVINLVQLSPQSQRVIARKVKDELGRNGLKDVNVRVVNGTFWLEGVVGSNEQKKFAMDIAEAYIPGRITSLRERAGEVGGSIQNRAPIINFLSVNEKTQPPPAKKMVKVTTQFVELSKDYLRQFAFQWQPLIGQDNSSISINRDSDGTVNTNSSNTLSATISNLFPKLESAKNAGYARIIQSGMIIVQDGGNAASLKKTSVINFPVGSGETQRVVKAEIGFSLDVNAKILDQEKVELGPNISITLNSGTEASPIESKNEVKTVLVVKSKESAVIGGVVQGESRTAYDKNPPFGGGGAQTDSGATPLFDLTKSKSYTNQKNQFAIFMTPEIIASASEGSEEIRRKFRKRSR